MIVLNSMGLVPMCHSVIVLLCLCGSKKFSCGNFMGSKCFLLSILWAKDVFSWVFCGSKILRSFNFGLLQTFHSKKCDSIFAPSLIDTRKYIGTNNTEDDGPIMSNEIILNFMSYNNIIISHQVPENKGHVDSTENFLPSMLLLVLDCRIVLE